jgi:hypothetical protein
MDPDNRIARHRDESCHHRRIIFSVGPVVARKGVGADKLKIFIFSDWAIWIEIGNLMQNLIR